MAKKIAGAIKKEDFNYNIRPQDDFFHYASGGWLKKNPIPKTEVRWGSFYVLRDENRTKIRKIFNEICKDVNPKGTTRLLKNFYESGLDERTIEKLGISPIKKHLAQIDGANDLGQLTDAVVTLHSVGIHALWSTFVSLDEKDSARMALYVHQGELGLPEREYYLSDSGKFPLLRKKYLKHITNMLSYCGVENREATTEAKNILVLETALAKAMMSAEQRRDVIKLYNKISLTKFYVLMPKVDLKTYVGQIGVSKVKSLIVGQPKYLTACSNILSTTPLSVLKNYFKFLLVINFAEMLPRKISSEKFAFYGKTLTGQKERKPGWQRVIGVVDSVMTEAIGQEYVARHFTPEAEKIMEEMVRNLRSAFRERIKNLDWMTTVTKRKALKKLSTFRSKLVQPKHPRSYSELNIKKDRYFENVFNAQQKEFFREIGKLFRPINRSEWFMGAHVVNAYYWPNQNEIVFPAGILQPPFFDHKGDIAMNYGSIGAIIGHELTHGFDDKGSLFDHSGNLKNWWSKQDRTLFTKKTKIIKQQYDHFVAAPGINVNGALTLGENIADLGGIVLAYQALEMYMKEHGRLKTVEGYTPEQRFFFGCVASERGLVREEAARLQALSDPHAPAYTRVNGPLAHIEEFYNAFDVRKGDKMYRDPNARAHIW